MSAVAREQKLQKELETIKRFAEWAEREEFGVGHKKSASHFALIAMGAEAILEEVIEARECEKTGQIPSYCV